MVDEIPIPDLPEIEGDEIEPKEILPETKDGVIRDNSEEPEVAQEEKRISNQETESTIATEEKEEAKTATFGIVEVKEDLETDLLTPNEREVYQKGFGTLKKLVTAGDNNIHRMVLTSPDMTSAIVGLQPFLSIGDGEGMILNQAFARAGNNAEKDYSFLEFGVDGYNLNAFVNDKAAENVLREHQKVLGLSLPTEPLQKSEILSYITQLLNGPSVSRADLALGLLSGFPIGDSTKWVEQMNLFRKPIPHLKKIGAVENPHEVDPISLLEPGVYKESRDKSVFFPDRRGNYPSDAQFGFIEGMGLSWKTQLPPTENTTRHLQKLLQVDRELKLVGYIHEQRSASNMEDVVNAIKISRKLSGKSGLLSKIKLPKPFGIFTSLGRGKTESSQT